MEEIFLHNDNDVYSYKERVPSRLLKRSALTGHYIDIFLLPENLGKAPGYGGTAAACVDVDGDGLYEIIFTTFTKGIQNVHHDFPNSNVICCCFYHWKCFVFDLDKLIKSQIISLMLKNLKINGGGKWKSKIYVVLAYSLPILWITLIIY